MNRIEHIVRWCIILVLTQTVFVLPVLSQEQAMGAAQPRQRTITGVNWANIQGAAFSVSFFLDGKEVSDSVAGIGWGQGISSMLRPLVPPIYIYKLTPEAPPDKTPLKKLIRVDTPNLANELGKPAILDVYSFSPAEQVFNIQPSQIAKEGVEISLVSALPLEVEVWIEDLSMQADGKTRFRALSEFPNFGQGIFVDNRGQPFPPEVMKRVDNPQTLTFQVPILRRPRIMILEVNPERKVPGDTITEDELQERIKQQPQIPFFTRADAKDIPAYCSSAYYFSELPMQMPDAQKKKFEKYTLFTCVLVPISYKGFLREPGTALDRVLANLPQPQIQLHDTDSGMLITAPIPQSLRAFIQLIPPKERKPQSEEASQDSDCEIGESSIREDFK